MQTVEPECVCVCVWKECVCICIFVFIEGIPRSSVRYTSNRVVHSVFSYGVRLCAVCIIARHASPFLRFSHKNSVYKFKLTKDARVLRQHRSSTRVVDARSLVSQIRY